MRIVLIGVSHWHTPFDADPVLAMPDAVIAGASMIYRCGSARKTGILRVVRFW